MTGDVIEPILKVGGPVALYIVLGGLAVRWIVGAYRERRKDRSTEVSTTTNDLATANAGLRASLEAERKANSELRAEVDEARRERDELADKLIQTKRDYEAQIDVLRAKVAEISSQLETLTNRLRADPPPTH